MHVFCPDCNAKYRVNERSSLTKTVKFVCYECGSSWVDKFEKLENTKRVVSESEESDSNDVPESNYKDLGEKQLNSLALEEVQNSFGNHQNRANLENVNTESGHIFQFETSETSDEIGEEGPSKTFPQIRNKQDTPSNDQIEGRDAKEIEIEKRLKESSELLKKAKQPYPEKKEPTVAKNKPKNRKALITFSILLLVAIFTYNLTILFIEDILREVPFASEILNQVSRYTNMFKDILFIIIERIMNFIPNLV